MGRITVEFEIKNYDDIAAVRAGTLEPSKVRSIRLRGIVDTGSMRLVLPGSAVKALGFPSAGKAKVRYADTRRASRKLVDGVYVELLGRHAVFQAIVEPKRKEALIGAIVLEALDLLSDCTNQRLVPRDPKYILSEIE